MDGFYDLPLPKGAAVNRVAAMTVFFILNTSGSMAGVRIQALNAAMDAALSALSELDKRTDSCHIQVCILEYNSCWRWITAVADGASVAEPVQTVMFRDLHAFGMSQFGAALKELDYQLSSAGLMKTGVPQYVPTFIFVSGEEPSDDWKTGLERIKSNKWFRRADIFAIYIHNGYEKSELETLVLEQLVGGQSEYIFEPVDLEAFRTMCQEVAVCTSMTKMGLLPDTVMQDLISDNLKAIMGIRKDDDRPVFPCQEGSVPGDGLFPVWEKWDL